MQGSSCEAIQRQLHMNCDHQIHATLSFVHAFVPSDGGKGGRDPAPDPCGPSGCGPMQSRRGGIISTGPKFTMVQCNPQKGEIFHFRINPYLITTSHVFWEAVFYKLFLQAISTSLHLWRSKSSAQGTVQGEGSAMKHNAGHFKTTINVLKFVMLTHFWVLQTFPIY